MNIGLYDILTLDNNIDYIVSAIVEHNNIKYFFLCEEKHPTKIMFCFLRENKLVKVDDAKLIEILKLKIAKELLNQ